MCAEARMPPCAPSASIGEMKASSPPSTAKPSGGSARSSMVSLSIPPDGVLDADHAGEVGQPPDGVGGQVLAGPVRDVIDDERDRAGRGERREVRDNPGLAGPQKGWHQTERRRDLGPPTQGGHGRRPCWRRPGAGPSAHDTPERSGRRRRAVPPRSTMSVPRSCPAPRCRTHRRPKPSCAKASSAGKATDPVASNGVIRGTYTPVRVMTSSSATRTVRSSSHFCTEA